MAFVFGFSLRLFFCFLAAKLILIAFDVEGRAPLLGLTALFLANVYWLDHLTQRGRLPERAPQVTPQPETPKAKAASADLPVKD